MGVTLVPSMSVPPALLAKQSASKPAAKAKAAAAKTTAKLSVKPSKPAPPSRDDSPVRYLPIVDPAGGKPPTRRVVLAWRRSYTRYEAIAAMRNAIYACPLPGVTRLS
jgi:hypothetical protein